MQASIRSIGVIRTPYTERAPRQPRPEDDHGEFRIVLDEEFRDGLRELERFRWLYVIFWLDRAREDPDMLVHPAPAPERTVGLFASRSPHRPNRIGLSIVRIKAIEGATIHISPIDALDGTPLLDLKPYIAGLDTKPDANRGWLDDEPNRDFTPPLST